MIRHPHKHKGRITIGKNISGIEDQSVIIDNTGDIIIGDFVTISSHCNIMSGSDDFTSPKIGNPTTHESFREIKRGEINIGNFCRIGTESIIMPGVTIGEGAVVGANSVVTKNLDPFGIYIGNKKIGERNKKEIEKEYDNFLKLTI